VTRWRRREPSASLQRRRKLRP